MGDVFQRTIGDKVLYIETGDLAGQADGAVTVRCGDTLVLVTTVVAKQKRDGIDFIPLTVEFEERLYAIGKIPGSFFRREGRPTQDATLSSRLTDRSVRPLFPKNFRNEIQVITTVLSADQENLPDVLSMVGASASLSISGAPFDGPIAACRVGYIDGELVLNPTYTQLKDSKLDLVISGTKDAVVMVEAGASEVSEALVLEAIEKGQTAIKDIVSMIEELVQSIEKPSFEYKDDESHVDSPLETAVIEKLNERDFVAIFEIKEREDREEKLEKLSQEVANELSDAHAEGEVLAVASKFFDEEYRGWVRSSIIDKGQRPDGRSPEEIRPISSKVGLIPRTHGSGLFNRGQTQVLTLTTLGSMGDMHLLDNLSPEQKKRYMHHYNFAPYSTGETGRVGSPKRREIGHGALAERALMPVIPGEEEFPYTIRLVSEVLSSNGSTSMASVCASSLSLMDAGVPIKKPVAGIAMGLVIDESGSSQILTDIQGLEDHLGDMDFKVAGTNDGITALQMDLKVKGISSQLMSKALDQAREARLTILDKMNTTIGEVRSEMSPHAPRVTRISIPVSKIGAVIGPGGKMIRSIIEETEANIDVRDDGTVFISAASEEASKKAIQAIEALTKDVEVGTVYTGKVKNITSFGVFVEILPGKDGLIRLAELSDKWVEKAEDEVSEGDVVTVIVTEVDRQGRINLSRKALLGRSNADGKSDTSVGRGPEKNLEGR